MICLVLQLLSYGSTFGHKNMTPPNWQQTSDNKWKWLKTADRITITACTNREQQRTTARTVHHLSCGLMVSGTRGGKRQTQREIKLTSTLLWDLSPNRSLNHWTHTLPAALCFCVMCLHTSLVSVSERTAHRCTAVPVAAWISINSSSAVFGALIWVTWKKKHK